MNKKVFRFQRFSVQGRRRDCFLKTENQRDSASHKGKGQMFGAGSATVAKAKNNRTLKTSLGFTLVEILVSMAVLMLIMVLVAELMSSATATIGASRKHMDPDSQARLIFDRMAVDFSRMVMRQDVDYHLRKIDGGSDEMAFYCEAPGYYSDAGNAAPSRNARNPVSVVGYRVLSDTFNGRQRCQLERGTKGLGWEPNGASWQDMAYLPITLIAGSNARWPDFFTTSPADPDFQMVGDQVFRFEFTYVLSDGTLSSKPVRNIPGLKCDLAQSSPPGPSADRAAGYSKGSRWFDTTAGKGYICLDNRADSAVWGSIGVTDVGAIVVALAILDPTSRVIVNDFTAMANALPDAPPTGEIASAWEDVVKSGSFAQTGGIPLKAASAVRIYQRYFPIASIQQPP
jgi:type II secretory pathway component PulJ